MPAIADDAGEKLAKDKGCTACHGIDKKIVGPAYKEVAAKHKGEADAEAKLEKVVRSGSKGTYGPMPMPPNPASKISDEELHSLVEWVLTK